MRILFGLVLIVFVIVGSCSASGEFAGLEVYANADPLFFAGRDCTRYSRVVLWVTSGQEFGFTCGPKFGPVSLGIGSSFGRDEGNVSLSYLNFDFRVSLKFYGIAWESVNLYQKGQGEINDFYNSRDVFTYRDFLMGIFGENRKESTREAQLFWGPFLELGKIKVFSANKLCFGVNILEPSEYWVAWFADF